MRGLTLFNEGLADPDEMLLDVFVSARQEVTHAARLKYALAIALGEAHSVLMTPPHVSTNTRNTAELLRLTARLVGGLAMIYMGIMHFAKPEGFMRIMPPWLPAPLLLVQVSGVFEILGGVGLFIKKVRRAAGIGLIALFVAVSPANIYSAMHGINPLGEGPSWVLWARLPFQILFIAWAYWVSRDPPPVGHRKPLHP